MQMRLGGGSWYALFALFCGGWGGCGAQDKGIQPQVYVSSPQPSQLVQEGQHLMVVARLLGLDQGRHADHELQVHMMVDGEGWTMLMDWNLNDATEWEARLAAIHPRHKALDKISVQPSRYVSGNVVHSLLTIPIFDTWGISLSAQSRGRCDSLHDDNRRHCRWSAHLGAEVSFPSKKTTVPLRVTMHP